MSLTATTLIYAIDNYVNEIQVTAATNFIVGLPIRVDNELMKIHGIDGTRISVSRGIRGTKAQAHNAKADCVTGPFADFPEEMFPAPGSYTYSAAGAISIAPGIHKLAIAAGGALTLADPTTAQEGIVLTIVSIVAQTHTLTYTAGFAGTTTSSDVATFNAIGDTLTLLAVNGVWMILAAQSVSVA
jgi:hypothetical protein